MLTKAHALWTALITPLTQDYSLDTLGLTHIIREQKQANAGLVLLGSTGESLNLSLDQKKALLSHALLANSSDLPVMVGVPGHDLQATMLWLEYLETLPIDAYLMITPIYARPGDEGQYHWFKTLMDRASRPVMLYNVPKRCGTSLSLKAVERLCNHPNYWSIKDASGSVEQFRDYVRASNQPVYCGDDGLFPDFAEAGSVGLVSVASNVWPLASKVVIDQCLAKSFTAHDLWAQACNELFSVTNPVGVKRILAEEERIQSATVMPPLSHLDFASSHALHAASMRIDEWAHDYL